MPGELSGPQWVARFPGSSNIADCAEPFRSNLHSFVNAMRAAGATVDIASTLRPPQRAYLMHWSWQIARGGIDPRSADQMAGVGIDWVHVNASGQLDMPASRSAADQMVQRFGIVTLAALASRHTQGRAVDMDIGWSGNLTIAQPNGPARTISSHPRSGMNPDLAQVGAAYGVRKAAFSNDPPHWSDDGH